MDWKTCQALFLNLFRCVPGVRPVHWQGIPHFGLDWFYFNVRAIRRRVKREDRVQYQSHLLALAQRLQSRARLRVLPQRHTKRKARRLNPAREFASLLGENFIVSLSFDSQSHFE